MTSEMYVLGRGGKGSWLERESLVCRLEVGLHPQIVHLFICVPTMCKALLTHWGYNGKKCKHSKDVYYSLSYEINVRVK